MAPCRGAGDARQREEAPSHEASGRHGCRSGARLALMLAWLPSPHEAVMRVLMGV